MEENVKYTIKYEQERRKKWDLRLLGLCKYLASWSKDPSTKCASVIVRNVNKIVSTGYNGYAKGIPDDHTLNNREEKYPRIIHAELNAILMADRDLSGCTLYVYPLMPCGQCAAAIIQSDISRVVSVIPGDPERAARWMESNAIATDMFSKRGIELTLINEVDVNVIV